jgi:hypothetical protein
VDRLLPQLRVWPRRALALFSLGIALAGSCSQAHVAAVLPGSGTVASGERRLRRWLAQPRLDVTAIRQALARPVLQAAAAGTAPLLLALDETSQGTRRTAAGGAEPALKVLALRLLYRRRAVPLAWDCHANGRQAKPYADLIADLFAEVAAALPPGDHEVIVVVDRGLSWPAVIHACQAHGWHWVFRLQRQTRLRTPDGQVQALAELVPQPGTQWYGSGALFKDAGWLAAQVVAVWRSDHKEPWLLGTDQPATAQRCREYGKRMWEEESFRDDKSSGFGWQRSQVREPSHANRLLLLLQLAMLLVLSLGTQLIKRGQRRHWTRPDRRDLSLFTLGLRHLLAAVCTGQPLRPRLALDFR